MGVVSIITGITIFVSGQHAQAAEMTQSSSDSNEQSQQTEQVEQVDEVYEQEEYETTEQEQQQQQEKIEPEQNPRGLLTCRPMAVGRGNNRIVREDLSTRIRTIPPLVIIH